MTAGQKFFSNFSVCETVFRFFYFETREAYKKQIRHVEKFFYTLIFVYHRFVYAGAENCYDKLRASAL